MIHAALTFVKDILNEHFKQEFEIQENKVILSNIMNPEGTIVIKTEGKIVFFLINLNEEPALKINTNHPPNSNASFSQRKPAIQLNLDLMFCANFVDEHYEEGLKYLSSLIQFFQNNNRLNPELSGRNMNNNPLFFGMCRLDYSELSHVWSAIGSKIMPSVIYKVRLLAMDDAAIDKVIPTIKELKKNS
jgi:hypothetical protein